MTLPIKIPFGSIKPILHKLEPETAHGVTIKALKYGLNPKQDLVKDERLKQTLWGLNFENPIGLSAGFDKNAEAVKGLFDIGFGAVEVGTVTPNAQQGNPRPRVFRDIETNAVINRMGFPNKGLRVFINNIDKYLSSNHKNKQVLGLNIGMNKEQTNPADDYCLLIDALARYADYLTINISSPNTPGLRNLQQRENLLPLIEKVQKTRKKFEKEKHTPLLIKLAPDLTDQELSDIAETLMEVKIDGVILSNTTLDRPKFLPENFRSEMGGLSGHPLTEKSTNVIRNFYKLTKGSIPIVGVGGVSSGQDAYDKICAGASLIQLYSALIFQGPDLIADINNQLLALLDTDGYKNITEAIGSKNTL